LTVGSAREAFDRHAAAYDRVFPTEDIRSEVWDVADRVLLPRAHVLDLGCGTGDDAIHFAERGLDVTAIDISPEMISALRRKQNGAIQSQVADMRAYRPTMPLDGVFSNFGAMNCVADLDWLLKLPIVPGGHVVLTLMGRLYPLECAVSLLKGQPRLAFRRFKQSSEAVVEGVRFTVHYHPLASLQKALASKFDLLTVKGLRCLMPAPHLEHLRRYSLIRILEPADRFLCSWRPTAQYADHFVTVWRCRET